MRSSPDIRCCLRPLDGGVDDIGVRLIGVGHAEALNVGDNLTVPVTIDHHERLDVSAGVVDRHCAMVLVLVCTEHYRVRNAVRPIRAYTPGQSGGGGADSDLPRLIGMLEEDRVPLGEALHGECGFRLGGADTDLTAASNSHAFADICEIPGMET